MKVIDEAAQAFPRDSPTSYGDVDNWANARLEPDPAGRLKFSALYADYLAWCSSAKCAPFSQRALGVRFARAGLGRSRDSGSRYWLGLRFRA